MASRDALDMNYDLVTKTLSINERGQKLLDIYLTDMLPSWKHYDSEGVESTGEPYDTW